MTAVTRDQGNADGLRAMASSRDIVLTGCGRAYVFPPALPLHDRLAGIDHPAHRIGYVEPEGTLWVPRSLGNVVVGDACRSRLTALNQVLHHAGTVVDAPIAPRVTFAGRLVLDSSSTPGGDAEVWVDRLGSVFVGKKSRRGPVQWLMRAGAVWPTGMEVAALPVDAASRARTLHSTRRQAVTSLIVAAGISHSLIHPSAGSRRG